MPSPVYEYGPSSRHLGDTQLSSGEVRDEVRAYLASPELLHGSAAAFIRVRFFRMNQEDFAKAIGVSRTSVTRWEAAHRLLPMQDYLLRAYVLGSLAKDTKAPKEICDLAASILSGFRVAKPARKPNR